MYYLLLLLVIAMITFILILFNVDVKKNRNYLLIIMIIIALFLGIRGAKVGPDMTNYYDFFEIAKNNTFSYLMKNINFEIGFKIYTKLFAVLSGNFRLFVFATSIISMIGSYYYIRENSKNYYSSIFMFITFNYYIYNFCTIRQSIAVTFLLLAFNSIKKADYKKFISLVLVASLFHKTAIVFLALYIIKWIPDLKKYVNVYLLFCIMLLIFKGSIIDFFTLTLYKTYLTVDDMSGSGYYMLFFILGMIIFFGYFKKTVDIQNNLKNKLLFLMLLFSLPFQILSLTQGFLARIVLYFNYSLIILIPEYLESLEDNKQFIMKTLYYILLTIFFIVEVNRNLIYVPYSIF